MGYKLIVDGSVVDAGVHICYVRYNPRLKMFLACKETEAHGIASQNGSTYWLLPNRDAIEVDGYQTVEFSEIPDDEATELMNAINEGADVIIEEPVQEDAPALEIESDNSLDLLKQYKITQMSVQCEKTIEDGFDVIITDGTEKHFRLTKDDQLELFSLSLIKGDYNGAIPYRISDVEFCTLSEEDFDEILLSASRWRVSQHLYLKNICAYINSLDSYAKLREVVYGMEIPVEGGDAT